MVADMARGLTWYIQPHTSMQFSLANPGIERLRISYLHHTSIKYADIIGGNSVRKETIEWEDDDCWIVRKFDRDSDEVDFSSSIYSYYYIDKVTFNSWEMPVSELKEYKKTHKEIQNKVQDKPKTKSDDLYHNP